MSEEAWKKDCEQKELLHANLARVDEALAGLSECKTKELKLLRKEERMLLQELLDKFEIHHDPVQLRQLSKQKFVEPQKKNQPYFPKVSWKHAAALSVALFSLAVATHLVGLLVLGLGVKLLSSLTAIEIFVSLLPMVVKGIDSYLAAGVGSENQKSFSSSSVLGKHSFDSRQVIKNSQGTQKIDADSTPLLSSNPNSAESNQTSSFRIPLC